SNIALALAMGGLTVAASAQVKRSTLDYPIGETTPYALDSGRLDNPAITASTAFEEEVMVEGSGWIRIYFGETTLAPRSYIRITSLLDGEVQELDAAGLEMWSNTSAYFNGDRVKVELIAGPDTVGNRLVIEELGTLLHMPVGGSGQCGICGSDDRVPSDEEWTARLFPAGCTASVFDTDSCMVSAGHCVSGGMVVQFNVPNSTGGCFPINPPVADQFPIILFNFNNNGPGDDWSVLVPGQNNEGDLPYQRFGALRTITNTVSNSGWPCSITGYGVDLTCVLSQTQQTSGGVICQVFSNAYEFSVDLRGGNSGSSLLNTTDPSGEIIGIATHCPCCNIATRITNADFAQARLDICPNSQSTTLPFFDDIPEVILDPTLWTTVLGAEGSTRGLNEPSPDLSMNLDATNPGGDEAHSAMMDTSSVNDLRVTYWYQQTGADDPPEDGDDLIVEYQHSSGAWIEINRHLGSGPDMTDFAFVALEMPNGAKHPEFRLRFVSTTTDSAGDDDHFVDDICIGGLADCPDMAEPCPWDLDGSGSVGTADLLDLLSQWGTDPGGPPDFDGDGNVGTSDLLELLSNWGECP
ncbi:MAG: trypsin-like serine peptidase, partial [Planctomycetota bacterium]